VTGTTLNSAFSILLLGNLLSMDKAIFYINHPKTKEEFQSGPQASPSPFAGVLQAMPARSMGLLLGSPLSATNRHHGPPFRRGERITSRRRGFEHPWQCRIKASDMEVEDLPPCRQKIVAAQQPAAWMSSGIDSPPSSSIPADQRIIYKHHVPT
jgi:hypothetical protein